MTEQSAGRRMPPLPRLIAGGLVVLGLLLSMFVSWGFLILAGLGAFGPGILRELGWLRDQDEFQRQATYRAGYLAYLVGGWLRGGRRDFCAEVVGRGPGERGGMAHARPRHPVDDLVVQLHAELLGTEKDGVPSPQGFRFVLGRVRPRHACGLVERAGGASTRRGAHGLRIRRAVFRPRVDGRTPATSNRRIARYRGRAVLVDRGSSLDVRCPQVVERAPHGHTARRSADDFGNRAPPGRTFGARQG